jgi:hypothetical protein
MRHPNTVAWTMRAAYVLLGIAVVMLATPRADGASVESTEGRYAIAGGVLRDGGLGWRVHTEGHASENLNGVRCDRRTGVLHVGIASSDGPVGFGAVTPDETLARAGITAGVSATRDTLRVSFFKGERAISCEAAVFDRPRANAWVLWTVPV